MKNQDTQNQVGATKNSVGPSKIKPPRIKLEPPKIKPPQIKSSTKNYFGANKNLDARKHAQGQIVFSKENE